MKKRLFSILLALCMVLCLVPTTFPRSPSTNTVEFDESYVKGLVR